MRGVKSTVSVILSRIFQQCIEHTPVKDPATGVFSSLVFKLHKLGALQIAKYINKIILSNKISWLNYGRTVPRVKCHAFIPYS